MSKKQKDVDQVRKLRTKYIKKADQETLNEYIYNHRYLFENRFTLKEMPFNLKELQSWLKGIPPRGLTFSIEMEMFDDLNIFLDNISGLNGNPVEIAEEYLESVTKGQ